MDDSYVRGEAWLTGKLEEIINTKKAIDAKTRRIIQLGFILDDICKRMKCILDGEHCSDASVTLDEMVKLARLYDEIAELEERGERDPNRIIEDLSYLLEFDYDYKEGVVRRARLRNILSLPFDIDAKPEEMLPRLKEEVRRRVKRMLEDLPFWFIDMLTCMATIAYDILDEVESLKRDYHELDERLAELTREILGKRGEGGRNTSTF